MKKRFLATLPDVDYWTQRVPCQMACPVRTDAGRYVQLIGENRGREAYLTARSPNPFASVCGRVCAAPCEDHCRKGHFDAPVSIRALKRFVCERFGVESLEPETQQELLSGAAEPGNKWPWHARRLEKGRGTQRKVAVVGAGPAGLSCAHDLAVTGYGVTVFEATGRAGGMAFHGIPEFRLPPSLLDKEIRAIEELGVEIRYDSPLKPGYGLRELKEEGFEAVFLAIGTQKGRMLECPGSDLDGVVRAIEYLININNGYRVPRGKRVLVVGGGFVAFDAARMALRAASAEGAAEEPKAGMQAALDAARLAARAGSEVILASLESFEEMPVMRTAQGREEFEEAAREGIRFLPQRGVASFSGNGRVSRAEMIGVRRTYDEEGRFAPEFDPEVRETIETDLVILAIGQQADFGFLRPEDNLVVSPAGTIQVDVETLATTAPGIFAGGDVAFGPRNLIDAIANGKRAARSIDQFLSGEPDAPAFRLCFEKIPTRLFFRQRAFEQIPRKAPPTTDLKRRTGISEVEDAYGEDDARIQASRCLACHIQTIYDPKKCVLCNRCVDICPENCLRLVPVEEIALDPAKLAAAASLADVQDPAGASAMVKDDEKCIRCGLCAIRCPTDAMTMEILYYEQQ